MSWFSEERLKRFGIGALIGIGVLLIVESITGLPLLTELSLLSLAWIVGVGAWYSRSRINPLATFQSPNRVRDSRSAAEDGLSAQEVADWALRRAGYDPQKMKAPLHDIGLLVYTGETHPSSLARNEPVRNDATHIRPFIRFHFPLSAPGRDWIRFELVDPQGNIRYQDEDEYEFVPGSNLVTPRTWLPLGSSGPDGRWTLRVFVGKTPLAIHFIRWRVVARRAQALLQSDGEIDERQAIDRLADEDAVSLDDLLGHQEPLARSVGRKR